MLNLDPFSLPSALLQVVLWFRVVVFPTVVHEATPPPLSRVGLVEGGVSRILLWGQGLCPWLFMSRMHPPPQGAEFSTAWGAPFQAGPTHPSLQHSLGCRQGENNIFPNAVCV